MRDGSQYMAALLTLLKAHWPRCLLVTAVLLHLLMMGSLFWGYLNAAFYTSQINPQAVDFFAIYEAGHRAIEGQSLYYGGWAEPALAPYGAPYRYVPIFAYLAAPMTVLPAWWAYWGWVAFNELLLVLNAYATWRIAGKERWGVIAAAMWFVFTPFYLEQYMGQFSFLMATALFWTGVGLVRGRELLAGPAWLLSLITKSNSALMAPLFLRIGWWRTFVAGSALLALNLPYFLWRRYDFELFYKMNFTGFLDPPLDRFVLYHPADHGGLAFLRNWAMTLDPTLADLPVALSLGLAIGVVGCSLAATFLPRKVDPLALFAVWVAAFFLFFHVVWEFHYVMFLPVLVLLVALRPAARPWALAAYVLVALPTPYWLLNNVWNTASPEAIGLLRVQATWPAWGVVLQHAAKPLPVAALWAYLAVRLVRQELGLRRPALLGALSRQRVDESRP